MIFEKEGPENSEKTLELAIAAAKERGIKDLVIATTTGRTPQLLDNFDLGDLRITLVTHAYGYAGNGKNEMPEELRTEYKTKGYNVCTAAHALTGVQRSLSMRYKGIYPGEIIAETLKFFSRGTKVCVEIGAMACDGGYIRPDEYIVAVAGSNRGADTAVIMRPAHSHKIMETRIDEYICKPRSMSTAEAEEKKRRLLEAAQKAKAGKAE